MEDPTQPIEDDAMTTRQVVLAEVDVQIATAQRFPRSIKEFVVDLRTLATMTRETADSCFYSLPRAGGFILGPSIRFAELTAAAWKHLRISSRISDIRVRKGWDKRSKWGHVTVEGGCHDLERNVVVSSEVRRTIEMAPEKGGVDLTVQAAQSIARRNCILQVIPRALWEQLFPEVKKVAAGGEKGLVERKIAAVNWLIERGATEARILAACRKASVEDLDAEDLVHLRAAAEAIKDGVTTAAERFPEPKAAPEASAQAAAPAAATAENLDDLVEAMEPPQAGPAPEDPAAPNPTVPPPTAEAVVMEPSQSADTAAEIEESAVGNAPAAAAQEPMRASLELAILDKLKKRKLAGRLEVLRPLGLPLTFNYGSWNDIRAALKATTIEQVEAVVERLGQKKG